MIKGAILFKTYMAWVLVIYYLHLGSPLDFAIKIDALFLQLPVFYFAILTNPSILVLKT